MGLLIKLLLGFGLLSLFSKDEGEEVKPDPAPDPEEEEEDTPEEPATIDEELDELADIQEQRIQERTESKEEDDPLDLPDPEEEDNGETRTDETGPEVSPDS